MNPIGLIGAAGTAPTTAAQRAAAVAAGLAGMAVNATGLVPLHKDDGSACVPAAPPGAWERAHPIAQRPEYRGGETRPLTIVTA